MSDPPRLLSEGDPIDRALLRAWEHEQPSEEARARVLALAGVGAGAALGAAGVSKGGAVLAAKWLAIGLVGVGVIGGAVAVVRSAARPPSPAPQSVLSAPAAVAPPPAVTAVVAAPPSSSATVAVAPSPPTGKSPRPAPSALGEQVLELDRARRALSAGNAPDALRRVDAYEARFPHGALRDEAEVLRVEALLAAGDHAGATRSGERFLASHPDSPHAARVRALIGAP